MSTRSSIAILNKDKTVDSVYCHFDGYPDGVGYTLANYHNNEEAAKHIIELGDLSILNINLDPTQQNHSFNTPESDVSIFYSRDRGENKENAKAKHWDSFKDWLETSPAFYGAEYCYWWDGDMWHCKSPYEKEEIDLAKIV